MERVFLKDEPDGRIKAGDKRDYTISVWNGRFPGWEKRTKPVDVQLAKSVGRKVA